MNHSSCPETRSRSVKNAAVRKLSNRLTDGPIAKYRRFSTVSLTGSVVHSAAKGYFFYLTINTELQMGNHASELL